MRRAEQDTVGTSDTRGRDCRNVSSPLVNDNDLAVTEGREALSHYEHLNYVPAESHHQHFECIFRSSAGDVRCATRPQGPKSEARKFLKQPEASI